jgi:preprotein translocase subunit SecF
MGIIIGIVGSFVLATMVAVVWIRGNDYMKENHPDYKGEDFLNDDK